VEAPERCWGGTPLGSRVRCSGGGGGEGVVVAAVDAPPAEGECLTADVASAAGRVAAPPAPSSVTEGEGGCGVRSGGGLTAWSAHPMLEGSL
jgi:hypothetical protein